MTLLKLMRRGPGRGLAGALLLASLPKDHAELSPQLEFAYRASDAIVMEVDLDDLNPLEAVDFITSHGTLPVDQTLADVVGARKYAEIAKAMGLSQSAVEKHMMRALEACKASLREPAPRLPGKAP